MESKKEPNAIMELYCPNGEFDSIALQKLCSEKKAKIKSGEYYLVVFDKKENAVFPSNPFSAQYGIDLDIMGHVLGFYTFVSSNMYSKLELWKEKGPGARIDIK